MMCRGIYIFMFKIVTNPCFARV